MNRWEAKTRREQLKKYGNKTVSKLLRFSKLAAKCDKVVPINSVNVYSIIQEFNASLTETKGYSADTFLYRFHTINDTCRYIDFHLKKHGIDNIYFIYIESIGYVIIGAAVAFTEFVLKFTGIVDVDFSLVEPISIFPPMEKINDFHFKFSDSHFKVGGIPWPPKNVVPCS